MDEKDDLINTLVMQRDMAMNSHAQAMAEIAKLKREMEENKPEENKPEESKPEENKKKK